MVRLYRSCHAQHRWASAFHSADERSEYPYEAADPVSAFSRTSRKGTPCPHPYSEIRSTRPDDAGIGMHANVVVLDNAVTYVVYLTHPGRSERFRDALLGKGRGPDIGPMVTPAERRSSIQAARVRVVAGHLTCDRDDPLVMSLPTSVGQSEQGSSS